MYLQLNINFFRVCLVFILKTYGKDVEESVANGITWKTHSRFPFSFSLTADFFSHFIASTCTAVLCCRLSPVQKAEVVRLIKAGVVGVSCSLSVLYGTGADKHDLWKKLEIIK